MTNRPLNKEAPITDEVRPDEVRPDEVRPDEVRPDEVQTERVMWAMERITTLQKKNEEMTKTVQEVTAKIDRHGNVIVALIGRFGGDGINNRTNRRTRSTTERFQPECKKLNCRVCGGRQSTPKELPRSCDGIRSHERHIANNGAVAREKAQCINALNKENENKSIWIGTMKDEAMEQARVLQQHQLGQEAIAGVVKRMMNQQQL